MNVRIKRGLTIFFFVVFAIVVLAVVFVGPWPTYSVTSVSEMHSYQSAVRGLDASGDVSGPSPERLRAGWAWAEFALPAGAPLAGFGDRQGAPATGTRDAVGVRALALSDGADELIVLSSDLLIVPENIADRVRANLCAADGLCEPRAILFNSTHTHSGPGAWGPGLAAKLFAGDYMESVEDAIVLTFLEAIRGARADMASASIAIGGVDVPEHVRNRARDAETDPELNYLAVRREDGAQCIVGVYAAHSTVIGSDNFEYSGDYPGYFMRALEQKHDAFGMFLAGAMGSTSSRIDGPDGFARAQALGETLADRLADALQGAAFEDTVEIGAIATGFDAPSYQFRLSDGWRVSPNLFSFLGVDDDLWIHGARIGDTMLFATPCDMSGEISVAWKAWAEAKGIDLWVLSFNGDYAGYVSPDRYYDTAERGTDAEYEMFTMSWLGPNQEALFAELLAYMADRLFEMDPDV